jgi:hypothetical protein
MPSQRATFFSVVRESHKIIKFILIAHKNRVRLDGDIYVFIKNQSIPQRSSIHRIFVVCERFLIGDILFLWATRMAPAININSITN